MRFLHSKHNLASNLLKKFSKFQEVEKAGKTFYTATARKQIDLHRPNYSGAGNEILTECWRS